MLDKIKKARSLLVGALEIALVVMMATLVLDVMWQVLTRMASGIPQAIITIKPSRWTDELAVMLLIWVAMLGASVAFVKKAHLGVDYFVGKLPEKYQAYIEIAVNLVTAVFAVVCMIWGGYLFVEDNTTQVSPALGIPMSYVYVSVPISGFFFLMFSVENVIDKMQWLRKGEGKVGET